MIGWRRDTKKKTLFHATDTSADPVPERLLVITFMKLYFPKKIHFRSLI